MENLLKSCKNMKITLKTIKAYYLGWTNFPGFQINHKNFTISLCDETFKLPPHSENIFWHWIQHWLIHYYVFLLLWNL